MLEGETVFNIRRTESDATPNSLRVSSFELWKACRKETKATGDVLAEVREAGDVGRNRKDMQMTLFDWRICVTQGSRGNLALQSKTCWRRWPCLEISSSACMICVLCWGVDVEILSRYTSWHFNEGKYWLRWWSKEGHKHASTPFPVTAPAI